MPYPSWEIISARPEGLRRRRPVLLCPQSDPAVVGRWLVEYRLRTGDEGFQDIVVRERPMAGIEPLDCGQVHTFIDLARLGRVV